MLLEDKNYLEELVSSKEALVNSEEFKELPEDTQEFIKLELLGLRSRLGMQS